jgi:chromosome segregation ATPase
LRSWSARLGEVEAEIGELGPVNFLAAEEYLAETRRLAELEAGLGDARAAAVELEEALRELELELGSGLRSAMDRVGVAFRAHVAELLGGEGSSNPSATRPAPSWASPSGSGPAASAPAASTSSPPGSAPWPP